MSGGNFLPKDHQLRKRFEESNLMESQEWKKDILWMSGFSCGLLSPIPMWSGWNTSLSAPVQDIQKVWYLPQINDSPTSNTVVVETLKRSLQIASEAGKKMIAVTYDLAIAMKAMQIQNEESPKYGGVFVALDAFHIE